MRYIHVYTEAFQPATHWFNGHGAFPMEFNWPRNRLLRCGCCRKRRPAKNCMVQSYYDGLDVWCTPGKGCKAPAVTAARARQESRNRSAGQIRRWGRERALRTQ